MSVCAGKREQKGVRDCRGGLIGVSVRAGMRSRTRPSSHRTDLTQALCLRLARQRN